jgi:4-hydroxy-4-methyl-2-oxoglutarate aldolase
MVHRQWLLALIGVILVSDLLAQPVVTRDQVVYFTLEWQGERYPDGRPRVADELLERMRRVGLEEAWATLRGAGYHNKFEGDWHILQPQRPMVGRALTAAYMPASPELVDRMQAAGRDAGLTGGMNQWPVYMLQPGDVYVADGFGKIKEGTLFGNNIGEAIYRSTGTGAVVYGSARDLGGLREVEGFNAWMKGWHPSAIAHMMLISVNAPTRIGEAVALPGDIVLATEGGVLFIPPQLAERVIVSSEVERITDAFRTEGIRDGRFTLQQTYGVPWTEDIEADFFRWSASNRARLHQEYGVGYDTVDRLLATRSRNWQNW